MLRLTNFEKDRESIICDIYPEDSTAPGRLVFDITKGLLASSFLPEGYEWCQNHVAHAERTLQELARDGVLPKERCVMWY